MEIFNVKRRDILDFDNYMDLKKPGFGGPKSAEQYVDARGKRINKEPKLDGYQRTVKRDPLFNHEVYNPTYKAMGGDLVHKQTVGKNPYTYPDSYSHMGIPVVQVGSIKEGRAYSFSQFINEADERIRAINLDLAEDILFDRQIDWDGFADAPRGITGKSFTKNGEVVAYFDQEKRELVITPEAVQMDPKEFEKQYSPDDFENMADDPEEYDFEEDAREVASNDDEEYEGEPSDLSIEEIERKLKSFE
jgi:hypothetical protein